MTSVFSIITITCFLWRVLFAQEAKPIHGYSGESLVLKCGHSIKTENINVIAWHLNQESESIVQYRPGQAYPLQVNDLKYQNRIRVNYPSGNLTLKDLQWSDSGKYLCNIVTQVGGATTGNSYELSIHVKPKKVETKCLNKSRNNNARTKLCPSTMPNSGLNLQSISCSVATFPKAVITWIKPDGCDEIETKHCNIRPDKPEMCFSQLDKLCEGKYLCEARYIDSQVDIKVTGETVFVQFVQSKETTPGITGKTNDRGTVAMGDSDDENSASKWRVIVGLIVGCVLLIVVVVSLFYYCRISKRFRDPNIMKDENDPSCVKVIFCPCLVSKPQDVNLSYPVPVGNNDESHSKKEDEVPLHTVQRDSRADNEYHSDEDSPTSNPYNSISRRKKVRPEILQAVQAAKALMSTPEADKVNFMVQTIGGTKYKFEVEKGNRDTGSTENLKTGGDGANGEDEFLSIKGPTTENKPKVDVDDVD